MCFLGFNLEYEFVVEKVKHMSIRALKDSECVSVLGNTVEWLGKMLEFGENFESHIEK